jgi:hypothetical protein
VSTTQRLTEPALIAQLVGAAVQNHVGSVGVIVRDVPAPDPETLLAELKEMHEAQQPELRVAFLRPETAEAAKAVGLNDDVFSIEIEQAERWRNERGLAALIVVIARGDEAKLSSLEDFGTITSKHLKRLLVERALGGAAGENEVQGFWWGMLAEDDTIGLGQLIDYYLALDGKTGKDFKHASSRELDRLGLLRDPEFFDNPKPAALRKRLADNRDLVARLQTLTPKDRRTIKSVVKGESDPARKEELQKALDRLQRTRWEGDGMGAIDFPAAQQLVKARTARPSKDKDGTTTTRQTEKAVEVAAEALVDPDRTSDVDEVLTNIQTQLENVNDTSVRTQKVPTALSGSTTEVTAAARLDVVNLAAKLIDDGLYGGLVKSESDDINAVLRRFNAEEDILARWERPALENVLDHLAEGSDAGVELRDLFAEYDKGRTALLPYARVLASEPLIVAASSEARSAMATAVSSYEKLMKALWDHHDALFEAIGPDVEELLALVLLLDILLFKAGDKVFALLSPVHPLHLWHFVKYAEVVDAQREELPERDRELVAQAARQLPNFLTSLYIPATAIGEGLSLTSAGRLGAIPYYAKEIEANSSEDGLHSITALIRAFTALEPHARLGFRLALVDPPEVGAYLRSIVDLQDEGLLDGAHVVMFRRHTGASLDMRLDEDDEDRVAQLFRALSLDRRFTFEVRELSSADVGPSGEPSHLLVVFDRSEGRTNRARPALHPIQPLAMPRRLQYSRVHETVELEPAPGGLFEAYDRVVGRVSEGGRQSYLAVHQEEALREALGNLMPETSWLAVADKHVDRDLTLGALRVYTGRDGERDVAGFAASAAAFRRPLREVARGYNAFITEEELDDLLAQLSDLLDQGLLSLRPDHTGRTNHNRIKGLLGTLIAARWFRQEALADSRLLISLDSAEARRWMHLSDDPLRADLVGLEWTNDHCTVSVIEVKAVEQSRVEYQVDNGVVSGSAIDQMLATRRLLAAVLAKDREHELITTPARREVLREHFYRELTKGTYDADARKLWADRLQRLLAGDVNADVRCHLIDVRLGVDASTLQKRDLMATDGEQEIPTRLTELNEESLDALRQAEAPEPEAPPEPPAEEEEPPVGPEEPEPEPPTSPAPTDGAAAEEPQPEAETEETAPQPEPAEAPAVAEKEEAEAAPRARALLGTAPGTYGKPREIYFDPAQPEDPLPNPHLSITGETGSGKTQASKAIISELTRQGLPVLVLDFKDDYSDPVYAETEDFEVYDASFNSLPFNPLAPPVDPRGNRINPAHHVHQLAEIIKRIYKLGDQQAYRLREAIKQAYEDAGIGSRPTTVDPSTQFPPFQAVHDELAKDKANEALLGRLSPIFDLGLFSVGDSAEDLAAFMNSNSVVRLAQLPGDETKNSVAEFFLMALNNFLLRQPQIHALGRLLVLDEAWRLVESPFLIPLMREGRAFGLGVIIATQFPRDLPEAVRGSTATRLYFSQTQIEQVREVQRTVVGKTTGPEADHLASVMRGLSPLTCVLHSKQYANFVRLTFKPYFERVAERANDET